MDIKMKVYYKGYEVEVKREECMAGYKLVYFSVYRVEDGLCVVDSFDETKDTVRDYIKWMKGRVDEFIESKGASELMEDEYEL